MQYSCYGSCSVVYGYTFWKYAIRLELPNWERINDKNVLFLKSSIQHTSLAHLRMNSFGSRLSFSWLKSNVEKQIPAFSPLSNIFSKKHFFILNKVAIRGDLRYSMTFQLSVDRILTIGHHLHCHLPTGIDYPTCLSRIYLRHETFSMKGSHFNE